VLIDPRMAASACGIMLRIASTVAVGIAVNTGRIEYSCPTAL